MINSVQSYDILIGLDYFLITGVCTDTYVIYQGFFFSENWWVEHSELQIYVMKKDVTELQLRSMWCHDVMPWRNVTRRRVFTNIKKDVTDTSNLRLTVCFLNLLHYLKISTNTTCVRTQWLQIRWFYNHSFCLWKTRRSWYIFIHWELVNLVIP